MDSVTHEIESIAAGTHGGDVQLSTRVLLRNNTAYLALGTSSMSQRLVVLVLRSITARTFYTTARLAMSRKPIHARVTSEMGKMLLRVAIREPALSTVSTPRTWTLPKETVFLECI